MTTGAHLGRFAAAVAILLFLTVPGLAQEPATTFQELQDLVRPGEPLVVTDSSGVEVEGQLDAVSDSVIALETRDGRREFPSAEVSEIRRQADPVADGLLWGVLIGAGGGFAVGFAVDASRGEGNWLAPAIGGAGAGVGALAGLIGDGLRPNDDVLFRRPLSGARMLLRPLVYPGHMELRVAWRF